MKKGSLGPSLKLSLPPPDESSLSKFLTQSGTFMDGDLLVNRDGVRIVSHSDVAPAIAQVRTVYSYVGECKALNSYSDAIQNTLKLGYKENTPCIRDTNHLFHELPLLKDKLEEYINNMSVAGSWSQNAIQATNSRTSEGKKLSNGVYCNVATISSSSNEELTVLAMVGERFGLQQLDLLPAGVSGH